MQILGWCMSRPVLACLVPQTPSVHTAQNKLCNNAEAGFVLLTLFDMLVYLVGIVHPTTYHVLPRRYWTLVAEPSSSWQAVGDGSLPSDCHQRQDLLTLLSGDIPSAQAMKEALENLQRTDAKLRKAAGVAHV